MNTICGIMLIGWLTSLGVFLYWIKRAPIGREIEGIGFIEEHDDD